MSLEELDVRLLLVFEALMADRNVSRAAKRLGLGQPAVSGGLARLRRLFDDPLFVRAGGAMVPTPRAQRLWPSIEAALRELRACLSHGAPFSPATSDATFTVASTDYTSFVLLPALAAAVEAEAPRASLRVVGYDKDDVARLADLGQVDVALGVFPAAPDRDVVTPLFDDAFVGVARAGHPAVARGRISLDDYLAARHALVSVRRDAVGEVDKALAAQGLRRNVVLVVPHMLSLSGTLAATDLLAAVPARAAASHLADGLSTFELPIKLRRWHVQMLWSAARRNDAANAWLRTRIKAAALPTSPRRRAKT